MNRNRNVSTYGQHSVTYVSNYKNAKRLVAYKNSLNVIIERGEKILNPTLDFTLSAKLHI
jgi:hypothetical protein